MDLWMAVVEHGERENNGFMDGCGRTKRERK